MRRVFGATATGDPSQAVRLTHGAKEPQPGVGGSQGEHNATATEGGRPW